MPCLCLHLQLAAVSRCWGHRTDSNRRAGKDLGKRQKALLCEFHISQTVSLVLGSGKLKVTWLGQKTILRSLIRPTIRRGRGT